MVVDDTGLVAMSVPAGWVDVATAPNQKTLILPIEATSVLGSLSGIAEVAREAFGKKG